MRDRCSRVLDCILPEPIAAALRGEEDAKFIAYVVAEFYRRGRNEQIDFERLFDASDEVVRASNLEAVREDFRRSPWAK